MTGQEEGAGQIWLYIQL